MLDIRKMLAVFAVVALQILSAQTAPTVIQIYGTYCPAPVSSNTHVTLLGFDQTIESAYAQVGTYASHGYAYAYDCANFVEANARAYNWFEGKWKVKFPASTTTISAAGTTSAGGTVSLLNPTCSGFGSCEHHASVAIGNYSVTMQSKVEGGWETTANSLSLGTVTLGAGSEGATFSWTFTPQIVLASSGTGQYPLTGPKPFDPLSGTGNGNVAIVSAGCSQNDVAKADGWQFTLAIDQAVANVDCVTSMTLTLNGKAISLLALPL